MVERPGRPTPTTRQVPVRVLTLRPDAAASCLRQDAVDRDRRPRTSALSNWPRRTQVTLDANSPMVDRKSRSVNQHTATARHSNARNETDGRRIRTSPRRLTSPELPLHRFQRTSEVGLSLTVNDRFVFLTDRVILRTDLRTVKRRDNRNVKIYLPMDDRRVARPNHGLRLKSRLTIELSRPGHHPMREGGVRKKIRFSQ